MSEKVVETVHGKYNTRKIIKKSKLGPRSDSIIIRKDGEYETKFSSVKAAVKWAKEQG